jgi:anhydro-N-acetylmuramic acid kinase
MKSDSDAAIYIGTMTGTSMDGLDLVAVTFTANNKPNLLASHRVAYPEDLKKNLQQLATDESATVSHMCQLDTALGQFYAKHITQFINDSHLSEKSICAVAMHGQTVRHSITVPLPYTLQIGDPNTVAALTGLVVVADFRRRDIALGGQGAPLAPAYHNEAFRSKDCNRVIINIGGIANITSLPADLSSDIAGFDTGPGNTLMDYLSKRTLGTDYDNNGDVAHSGKILTSHLNAVLQQEHYFQLPAPKSTGTDYFSPAWLQQSGLLDTNPADAMATLVELTCISLAEAIERLPLHTDEAYVCGGGAHNRYLMQRLAFHLRNCKLETTAALGIHPDWVEAIAFAWMARQTLQQKPGNHPSVTNAKRSTILGAVYY